MSTKFLDSTGTLYIITKVKTLLSNKVDKVEGKGLSTNDFTNALLTKLNGIATGATKVTIDSALSSTSTNPVQNKVIHAALADKVDTEDGKGLSTNDFTSEEKEKLSGIATGANKTTVDSSLSSSSTNPVQNKVINTALAAKAPLASPTFTGTPKAPTASAGTNTTQVATTAFVTTAIANAVGDITGIDFSVVTALPSTGVKGTIYLLSNGGSNSNSYDEYIWVNSTFEKIGTTDVDLSGFVKTSDLVAITNSEIDAMFT